MLTNYQAKAGALRAVHNSVGQQATVGLERAKSRCPSLGRGRRGLVL